jgi:hypothetical protein
MPGYLMHQGSTVLCAHAGQAQPTAPDSRVKVSSQSLVTQSCTYTISGCPFIVGTANVPCVTGQWVTAATRIKASNIPVLLQDSQSLCTPNGTPMNIVNTQVRVKGT